MNKKFLVGVIGCGDLLRCETERIKASNRIRIKSLFDAQKTRAQKYADILGGTALDDVETIIDDPAVDLVLLFVPPWARKNLLVRCVQAGKHVLTTKPLGLTIPECKAMVQAVEKSESRCGVIYLRSGNSQIETCKTIFDRGTLGKLALVRHDWIHHYPQWNTWALDPKKNGGPFTDAEIHNMNFTRYLMGRPATHCAFFSENLAHPSLTCPDTEFMKIDFTANGSAYLFITWAADLKVESLAGNYREHIDITYMVTDQGWRLTTGPKGLLASKDGKTRDFPYVSLGGTIYDRFVRSIQTRKAQPRDIPTIREAYEDIKIIRTAESAPGRRKPLNLA